MVASVGPGWGLAVDAASFAATALCFARLRLPSALRGAPAETPLRQLREGWAEFTHHNWVWVVVLQFLFVNAMSTASLQVLGPAIAYHTMGRPAWGFALAAQTAGTLLGGTLAMRWQPRRALLLGVALGMVEVLPILALAHLPHAAVLLAAMVLSGLAIEQFSVAWEVSLQRHIPPRALARVYSYDAVGSFAAVPLGQLTIGPLAAAFGVSTTLDAATSAILAATVLSLAVPSVRRLTVHAPEPVSTTGTPPEKSVHSG